ncbi:hypothetical protein BDV3_002694 [Batrachochytrium dendrobatidis]
MDAFQPALWAKGLESQKCLNSDTQVRQFNRTISKKPFLSDIFHMATSDDDVSEDDLTDGHDRRNAKDHWHNQPNSHRCGETPAASSCSNHNITFKPALPFSKLAEQARKFPLVSHRRSVKSISTNSPPVIVFESKSKSGSSDHGMPSNILHSNNTSNCADASVVTFHESTSIALSTKDALEIIKDIPSKTPVSSQHAEKEYPYIEPPSSKVANPTHSAQLRKFGGFNLFHSLIDRQPSQNRMMFYKARSPGSNSSAQSSSSGSVSEQDDGSDGESSMESLDTHGHPSSPRTQKHANQNEPHGRTVSSFNVPTQVPLAKPSKKLTASESRTRMIQKLLKELQISKSNTNRRDKHLHAIKNPEIILVPRVDSTSHCANKSGDSKSVPSSINSCKIPIAATLPDTVIQPPLSQTLQPKLVGDCFQDTQSLCECKSVESKVCRENNQVSITTVVGEGSVSIPQSLSSPGSPDASLEKTSQVLWKRKHKVALKDIWYPMALALHHPHHNNQSVLQTVTTTSQRLQGISRPSCTLTEKFGCGEMRVIGRGATCRVRMLIVTNMGSTQSTPTHFQSTPTPQPPFTRQKRVYAVKEFRKRSKNESEKVYIKRMTSEFCISSSLHHSNVVETLDLVVDEHQKWCEVMEYCSGGTLFDLLREVCMTLQEVGCCFKQLIQGVQYIHSMGVAHRDLKPENILFNAEGQLKISDFGVSDVFKTAFESFPHLSKGLCGSKPYIAPEEFERGEYDAREVDIWATGVIYYVMRHTGLPWHLAVPDDFNYAVFLQTRNGRFKPIDSLENGCRELLNCILEPDPKKRYTADKISADPWFQNIIVCQGLECADGSLHRHICHKMYADWAQRHHRQLIA